MSNIDINKMVQIRDEQLGYILVPEYICEKILDSYEMQRLKDIKQTFMHPLYPNSTHDRFSHSLGVYHIGEKIFNAFKINVINTIKKLTNAQHLADDFTNPQTNCMFWEFIKINFVLACLIHDVGHAPYSHTFEKFYFMTAHDAPNADNNKKQEIKRQLIFDLSEMNDSFFTKNLINEFKKQYEYYTKSTGCKPHEYRGMYLVAHEEFGSKVFDCIGDYVYQQKICQQTKRETNANLRKISNEFICRMIGGICFDGMSEKDEENLLKEFNIRLTHDNKKIFFGVLNGVIRLLNGDIDADSLDYILRDVHNAGYDGGIDTTRIINSYTLDIDEKNLNCRAAFNKSALSVLQNFIEAKWFERFWIFGHHKIRYHTEILFPFILHEISRLEGQLDGVVLSKQQNKSRKENGISVNDILDDMYKGENSALIKGDDDKDSYSEKIKINQYIVRVINYKPKEAKEFKHITKMKFCDATDSAINSLFKQTFLYLTNFNENIPNPNEFEQYVEDDFTMLRDALSELYNRKEKISLFKSHVEFDMFVDDCYESAESEFLLSVPNRTCVSETLKVQKNDIVFKAIKGFSDKFLSFENAQRIQLGFEDSDEESETRIGDIYYFKQATHQHHPGKFNTLMHDKKTNSDAMFCFYKVPESKNHTLIKFDDRIKSTAELNLYGAHQHVSKIGLAFYFKPKNHDNKSQEKADYLSYFKNSLKEEFTKQMEQIKMNYKKIKSLRHDKTIRDAIYGDIIIPQRFAKIIEAKEFQRLHRIRQLATANLVYPNANHSRFAHSLGVFYLADRLIDHIQSYLEECRIPLYQADVDEILVAALCHDVGHLPLSHATEHAIGLNKCHEVLSKKIVADKDSELHKAVCGLFCSTKKEKDCTKEDCPHFNRITNYIIGKSCLVSTEEVDISTIFCKFLGSQIDLDRADYILRDALNCGVKFADIDIERLLDSFEITHHDGQYKICHKEKYLSDVEAFLISRYRMYENVYNDSYKLLTEKLLAKIMRRAKISQATSSSSITKLINLTDPKALTICDIMALDDNTLYNQIHVWTNSEDDILRALCKAFLNRTGFDKIISDVPDHNVISEIIFEIADIAGVKRDEIENSLINIVNIRSNNPNEPVVSKALDNPSDILIIRKNGSIHNIERISKIFGNQENKEQIPFVKLHNALYWNKEILLLELAKAGKAKKEILQTIKRVEKLIKKLDPRASLEIEQKFLVTLKDSGLFDDFVKSSLEIIEKNCNKERSGYKVSKSETIEQIDTYYDFADFEIVKNKASLRIREADNDDYKYKVTYKRSNSPCNKHDSIPERYEFERPINNATVVELLGALKESDKKELMIFRPNDNLVQSLNEKIKVKNKRTAICVNSNEYSFEIVFDSVVYESLQERGKETSEQQIEIELKSPEYYQRAALMQFSKDIKNWLSSEDLAKYKEKNKNLLQEICDSKYERAFNALCLKKNCAPKRHM